MTVIAMSQEMGTLGRDIAAGVAERLNLKLVRHEIGDQAAERMQVKKSLIRRYREGQAGWFEKRRVDESSLALYTAEQVYDLALEGGVLIRGWGATVLLNSVPHVPCIRVCAPLDRRVRWLMERLDTDDPQIARQEIERSDTAHAARIRQAYNVTLGDPLLYDMVLNTGGVSVETCVDLIVALAARPEFRPTPESVAHLQALALQARIQTALRDQAADTQIDITVDVSGDRVFLRGVVMDDQEKRLVQRIASEVAGVDRVVNELRVMQVTRRYTQPTE